MSRLNIDMELVRTFTPEQYARGLLAWAWLRPGPMEPIFASPFGDVFFRAADGIWWLDTIEGSISRRWTSKEALRAEIDTVAGQDDYLLAGLVLAEARGLRPGPDQVFDFAVAPVLGGSFETDNIVVVDFVVKLTIAGQLHDQLRQLPPGAKIAGIEVS
jgi:T6SS immunity protein Tdi1, C-terminal